MRERRSEAWFRVTRVFTSWPANDHFGRRTGDGERQNRYSELKFFPKRKGCHAGSQIFPLPRLLTIVRFDCRPSRWTQRMIPMVNDHDGDQTLDLSECESLALQGWL